MALNPGHCSKLGRTSTSDNGFHMPKMRSCVRKHRLSHNTMKKRDSKSKRRKWPPRYSGTRCALEAVGSPTTRVQILATVRV
ncbi:hypothetical protein E2C01_093940 [Portunus trituberculatus]|uniref:Uncharacterized protein n=1 Tax=Portunus trituberculatus TaxID=210409 RepID=A0A5B7JW81_PORTR|nr:hypothetical protein [Portunus trituberculatus]